MELDLEWHLPLHARWGARERLDGIRVFHDFDWLSVFPDERTQFQRGLVLARTVKKHCPADKTPALLLTQETGMQQGIITTGHYFVFVLNIDEWLATPDNAALAYLAGHLPVDPGAVREFVEEQLNESFVADWLKDDPQRLARLADLVDLGDRHPATIEQALDAIQALGELNEAQLRTLMDFVVQFGDEKLRRTLLLGATADEVGRKVALGVVGERVEARIADARRQIAEYRGLLEDQASTETDMQVFLTKHPLLFGLEYSRIRPQAFGPSGSMDFVLERVDGFNDIVELKGPNDSIIARTKKYRGEGVAPPHAYKLGGGLSQALAQAFAYRDRLTRHAAAAEELHGIANPREPHLIIVLGRFMDLDEDLKPILQELNRSLHRAMVVPYDLIALRAEKALDNITEYLGGNQASGR